MHCIMQFLVLAVELWSQRGEWKGRDRRKSQIDRSCTRTTPDMEIPSLDPSLYLPYLARRCDIHHPSVRKNRVGEKRDWERLRERELFPKTVTTNQKYSTFNKTHKSFLLFRFWISGQKASPIQSKVGRCTIDPRDPHATEWSASLFGRLRGCARSSCYSDGYSGVAVIASGQRNLRRGVL